jgi:hypothetical protein
MTAWIFLFCLEMIFALVNRTVLDMYSFPFIAFTYGPLLYFYVRHMIRPSLQFSPWNLLHSVPFLVFFAVSVIFREEPIFDDLTGFLVKTGSSAPLRHSAFSCFLSRYTYLSFNEIRRHQVRLWDEISLFSQTDAYSGLNPLATLCRILFVFILGGIDIMEHLLPLTPMYLNSCYNLFSLDYSFYAIRQR